MMMYNRPPPINKTDSICNENVDGAKDELFRVPLLSQIWMPSVKIVCHGGIASVHHKCAGVGHPSDVWVGWWSLMCFAFPFYIPWCPWWEAYYWPTIPTWASLYQLRYREFWDQPVGAVLQTARFNPTFSAWTHKIIGNPSLFLLYVSEWTITNK
jgi:hypothetical protein